MHGKGLNHIIVSYQKNLWQNFFRVKKVEKKIYHLGYEKFRLIAELNTFRNSKVYKYHGDEYVKFPTSKRNVFRPVSKKISLLRLKGIEEELNSLNKERA